MTYLFVGEQRCVSVPVTKSVNAVLATMMKVCLAVSEQEIRNTQDASELLLQQQQHLQQLLQEANDTIAKLLTEREPMTPLLQSQFLIISL